jgi:hypothetical protein
MGKMEAAGEVVSRLAETNWTGTQASSSESLEGRRLEIRKHIARMYLSAGQAKPGPDRMELLTEDALRLWKAIPTSRLTEVVEAAIVQAGSFVATAGLVAKLWKDKAEKLPELDHTHAGRRDQALVQAALAAPGAEPPTPEQRAENARMAAEIARKLLMGGAA